VFFFIAILNTATVTGYVSRDIPLDVRLLCGQDAMKGAAIKETMEFVMIYKSYFAVGFCVCA
jgi:hypothetical protein